MLLHATLDVIPQPEAPRSACRGLSLCPSVSLLLPKRQKGPELRGRNPTDSDSFSVLGGTADLESHARTAARTPGIRLRSSETGQGRSDRVLAQTKAPNAPGVSEGHSGLSLRAIQDSNLWPLAPEGALPRAQRTRTIGSGRSGWRSAHWAAVLRRMAWNPW